MPQHDLFSGWEAEHFVLSVHLPQNRPGGQLGVRLADPMDRTQLLQSVNWRRPRDLAGLPKVAAGLVAAWQYGPVLDVASELDRLTRLHLPRVPAHLG